MTQPVQSVCIPVGLINRFLAEGGKHSGDLIALYAFIAKTAVHQKTNSVNCKNRFISNVKGLGWSPRKVKRIKAMLMEMRIIENVFRRKNGKFCGAYVHLLVQQPLAVGAIPAPSASVTVGAESPPVGDLPSNALLDNKNINASSDLSSKQTNRSLDNPPETKPSPAMHSSKVPRVEKTKPEEEKTGTRAPVNQEDPEEPVAISDWFGWWCNTSSDIAQVIAVLEDTFLREVKRYPKVDWDKHRRIIKAYPASKVSLVVFAKWATAYKAAHGEYPHRTENVLSQRFDEVILAYVDKVISDYFDDEHNTKHVWGFFLNYPAVWKQEYAEVIAEGQRERESARVLAERLAARPDFIKRVQRERDAIRADSSQMSLHHCLEAVLSHWDWKQDIEASKREYEAEVPRAIKRDEVRLEEERKAREVEIPARLTVRAAPANCIAS